MDGAKSVGESRYVIEIRVAYEKVAFRGRRIISSSHKFANLSSIRETPYSRNHSNHYFVIFCQRVQEEK